MNRSIAAAALLVPMIMVAGETPDTLNLIASLSDAAAGSDKAEAAEKFLAADDTDATFALLLEAYRTTKDPDAELRLGRLIQADILSNAACIVTGKITALKDVDGKRCKCFWGASFWTALAPDRILKGPKLIRECAETYAALVQEDHHHLPLEEIQAGRIILDRGANYDFKQKTWNIVPMEVGEEGIWILRPPQGPEGRMSGPLGYTKLPISKLPRVEAVLAALKEKSGEKKAKAR